MREKFQRFMMGRYGNDDFNRFLFVLCIVFLVLNVILHVGPLYYISLVLLIITYYRSLSRDVNKRYKENLWYLEKKDKLFGFFSRKKYYHEQRKDYHIYTCPSCKQKIRIPKGKGKINVTCPKCRTSFVKRS